ncbi:hypothetical protein PR002_g2275 [Phytophthora rubi]|uniref:DUF6818 domain-containing protein n=1 Tax=Phytophthora rubi TaxID=129364 RepID=A0A6A3NVS1_9STRA|nr:hypothetical protein PR002_g2275 [Phytophthora rubi]
MARRGRIAGVENYSADDLNALLEYTGEVLPTGASEWENVRRLYKGYAADNGRADRELVSLKKKFQGLLNCKKPTGDARCPASQLDAEKEARRLERDERTALNNQVERLQCRNDETLQRFEAQKERLVRQHEEVIARMKAKNSELKTKIETLQEKLADERDKSRGLENANAKLEIQLAGSRGFSKH